MKLGEYIEQLKKDAERLEKEDHYYEGYVNKAEYNIIKDVIEDLEKIKGECKC